MALTDTAVKKLKPENKAKKYADGEGLVLIVNPNGTKLWRYRYRYWGKAKELSLGTYPIVSLFEAREKRLEAQKRLIAGKDPGFEKKEVLRQMLARQTNNFQSIADEWWEIKKEKWSDRQRKNVKNRLKNHVYPVIGNKPIDDIRAIEFLNGIVRRLEKEGCYETAHRVLQYCSAIFRFAVITERAPYNPLADLRGALKSYKHTNLTTIKIEGLPEFLHKLAGHKTAEINKLAIKLLMLTFVRPGELRRRNGNILILRKRYGVFLQN